MRSLPGAHLSTSRVGPRAARTALRACVAILALAAAPAGAEPLQLDEVPTPLRPWIDWVLSEIPDAGCPVRHGTLQRGACAWTETLSLDVRAQGARFEQRVRTLRRGWVALPGSPELWPEELTADGRAAAVVPRGGAPSVQLEPGSHTLRGALRWERRPEGLPIPAETGLVSLQLDGAAVPFPRREPANRLWLGGREAGESESEAPARVDLSVQRKLIDELPLVLETRLELRVSGPPRELELPRVLPRGFVPVALQSPLPARAEIDRSLRVQLRSGRFELRLYARQIEDDAFLGPPQREAPLAPQEIWTFEARPALRVVEVRGAPSIDPEQTELPPEWRRLPAYVLEPGAFLELAQQRRGDENPRPDALQLHRRLWLDFDGDAFTAQDRIGGSLHRSWRLEAQPGIEIGRAAVGGEPRWITQLGPAEPPGIELRQGQLDLIADLRIPRSGTLPATGWAHDFEQVSATLQLPPGWRLAHASGVDRVHTSWIRAWSLDRIFLALLGALAIRQLFGWAAGWLALGCFALTFPEPYAPRALWLAALAGTALVRVAPAGKLARAATLFRGVVLVLLAGVALGFAIREARLAMHPELGDPSPAAGSFGGLLSSASRPDALPAPPSADADGIAMLEKREGFQSSAARRFPMAQEPGSPEGRPGGGRSSSSPSPQQSAPDRWRLPETLSVPSERSADPYSGPLQRMEPIDPGAQISTGPGIPTWSWTTVELAWTGPVGAAERIRLWLVPPWLSRGFGWLRVAGVAWLFALLLAGGSGRSLDPRRWLRSSRRGGATALALLALAAPLPARAQLPTPEQLQELGQRLSAPPSCAPQCASSPWLQLRATEASLRITLQIDAAGPTAVPLPGSLLTWTPRSVSVDAGRAPAGLHRQGDGSLWLALETGRHEVQLEGPLADVESLDLPLPLPPHRVDARASGWVVSGARPDAPTPTLRLDRIREDPQTPAAPAASAPAGAALPGFAEVQRTLELGLQWTVRTKVRRVTPRGTPLALEIPLLPGESVTASGVEVEDGRARVQLTPEQRELEWTSSLEPSERIELVAPPSPLGYERWRLASAPLWHVEASGLATTHAPPEPGFRVREWRPRPGERVILDITRPSGAPGTTLTLDESTLEARPGLRATQAELALALRTSRATRHRLQLAPSAELLGVEIDGQSQPLRLEDGTLELPLHPGEQRVTLRWREPRDAGWVYGAPTVDLGAPSANAHTLLHVPRDRWVWLAFGPGLGPAVLFWSLLLVLAGVAVALGRSGLTPLGPLAWFLLAIGLSQVPLVWAAVFVGWLLALGLRARAAPEARLGFNALQIGLGLWTGVALAVLIAAVHEGLLGTPEMQIEGNGSSGALLRWYQDRTSSIPADCWVLWLPLWLYRVAMLGWALWLASALLGWLRWGWSSFSSGQLWRPRPS